MPGARNAMSGFGKRTGNGHRVPNAGQASDCYAADAMTTRRHSMGSEDFRHNIKIRTVIGISLILVNCASRP
jgi:hypothetical protein